METQRNLRTFVTSRKTSATSSKNAAVEKLGSSKVLQHSEISTPKTVDLRQPRKTTGSKEKPASAKPVITTQPRSKQAASTSVSISGAKDALSAPARSKPSKTMTLIEFQKLRQQAGASAMKEFQASCDKLVKTPEKLQKSPFYSPVKHHVSTAEVTQNIRARRQLNFGATPKEQLTAPLSSPAKKLIDKETVLDAATPWEISLTPESASEEQEKISKDEIRSELPSNDAVVVEERPNLLDSPFKQKLRAESDLNILPSTSVCRTPQKTPKKDASLSPTSMLSPGKMVSLFSPQKGFFRRPVKTAADVHNEAASRDGSGMLDAEAVRLRITPDGKQGMKRKVDEVLEATRAARKKLALVKEERQGLLYRFATSSTNAPVYITQAEHTKPATESKEPPLPPKIKLLDELFERADTIICTYANRAQSCCFERLRNDLLNWRKEPITYASLGHLMHFYPEAYVVRLEPRSTLLSCPDNLSGNARWKSVKEHYAVYVRDDTKPVLPNEELLVSVKMDPFARVRRKKRFHEILMSYAEQQHRSFLAGLHFVLPDGVKVTNWDPRWDLNSVQLPEPAKLPDFSKPTEPRTFEQAFKLTEQIIAQRNKPMFAPDTKQPTDNAGTAKVSVSETPVDEKIFEHPSFRYMDEATKARVREAEMKKRLNTVVKDPLVENRKRRLERMVSMARILSGKFSSERKITFEESDILDTMRRSLGNALTPDELAQHWDLFVEIYVNADWIFRFKCDGKYFIRKKNLDFGILQMEEIVQRETAKLST
ncbi:uncharacterized protein LOC129594194 [Paramacrobiotus metropolitanus]|uniref:uncharacterized protein LOC129594194 n=1 Tax=Paramacrobiotus metropolitanus TaxID=2943436 RepID=UPI0024456B83|nr:uncharacterized protein LOC129594194 [Paramacrobiotus metropolitanus]